jgi:virulence-associated protein VagC
MAKGRTNQPLVIQVAEEYKDAPLIESLRQQGHRVETFKSDADLILAPQAHQWNDMMWDYLPAALTAARKRRKTNALHQAGR